MTPVSLPLSVFAEHLSPLENPPWGDDTGAIEQEEVRRAIAGGMMSSLPCSIDHELPYPVLTGDAMAAEARWLACGDRVYHIARIAYLAVNPDPRPIRLEASGDWDGDMSPEGLASAIANGLVGIEDGSHRVAAAIVRGDTCISALPPAAPGPESVPGPR